MKNVHKYFAKIALKRKFSKRPKRGLGIGKMAKGRIGREN
jgi:hypothetical protein